MTRPFPLRARPSLIAAIDARAARLGQDRTKYILTLVERDLSEEKKPRRQKFASYNLIGAFSTGTGAGHERKYPAHHCPTIKRAP